MPSSSSSSSSSSIEDDRTTRAAQVTTSYLQSLPREARNLLAGGLAGMLAKTAVAPVDRIKILYQVTSARFRLRDVPSVARTIIESEGFGALWKGNTATMIRVFPYSGIQFMVFDYCKGHFLGEQQMRDQRRRMMMQQNQQRGREQHQQQRREVGVVGEDDGSRGKKKGGLTPVESMQAGMIAGLVSALLTYPLDMARAQLAVLRREKRTASSSSSSSSSLSSSSSSSSASGGGPKGGRGIGYVLSASFQHGGYRGLYRGITPTILGILPYSGLAFTINEQAKSQISHVTGREPSTSERLLCGAMSGLFAQTLSYPLEVTRRRMQTIGIVPTTGSESAAVMVAQPMKPPSSTEGIMPGGAAASEGTERLQQQQQQQHSQEQSRAQQHRPQSQHAQLSSHQRHHTRPSSEPPLSMITTMKRLFKEQGVRGFYKGVTMNWVKGPIAFSISFTAFDTIQGLIETEDERSARKGGGHSAKVNISRRLTNNDD